jgi:hypothetical protein
VPVRGKVPALTTWERYKRPQNRPDADLLQDWFTTPEYGITGLAVICGTASSQLAVRDFDAWQGYQHWRDQHQKLASELPTVQTHRGYQVWHRGQNIFRTWKNGAARGEYRGTAGQIVVAPPSLHPVSCQPYRWIVPLPVGGQPLPEVDPVAAGLLLPADRQRTRERVNRQAHLPITSVISRVPGAVGAAVRRAVSRSVPGGPRERNDSLLALVRHLDAEGVGQEHLQAAFDVWYMYAVRVIRTRDRDANWRQLLDIWERSQKRRADGRASGCLAGLDDVAAGILVPAQFREPQALGALYQYAAALQQRVGDGAFFLSSHLAARLIVKSQPTAYAYLKRLEKCGVLHIKQEGEPRPGGKATEWRFLAPAPGGINANNGVASAPGATWHKS